MTEPSPLTQKSSPAHTPQNFPGRSWSIFSNPLFADNNMHCDVETGGLGHLIIPTVVDSQDAAVQTASHSVAINDKVRIWLVNETDSVMLP